MPIRLLDQHTAELIAAGEVVERPSSVVKELVENAIDAGATSVQVDIERGGTTLIRVADNGGGIDAEDIPLAFLRHATSKVQTERDLDAIHTLGFRGEALASIASVARVELLTATERDEFASRYAIHGGEAQGLEAAARPIGTTITVQDLFYNTPARMKFLKKDVSEAGYITETITRLALSHPQIAFRYSRDGKLALQTPGDGKLETAVYAVLGAEFAKQLVQAEGEWPPYEVHGLATSPLAARASRSMQFFYINGRFVKNRTMMAALEQAYRGMTMQGKFPGGVLFLKMPAEMVDVNVHPAKTEVRFARESDVFNAVYKTVKAALMENAGNHRQVAFEGTPNKTQAVEPKDAAAPKAEAAPADIGAKAAAGVLSAPPSPAPGQIRAYNQMVDTLASDSSFIPYETKYSQRQAPAIPLDVSGPEPQEAAALHPAGLATASPVGKRTETATLMQETEAAYVAPAAEKTEQTSFVPEPEGPAPLRLVGEVFKTYILAESGSTLCVIDKHAAHERLLYEQLVAARGEPAAQQLLAPVAVTLGAEEKNALLQNEDTLAQAGIELEDFGAGSVVVRSVPSDIQPDNVQDLVVELGQRLSMNARDTADEKQQWVLHSVACRAAVKAGDKTPPSALLQLAQDILCGEVPPFCPHGRPVVLEITRKELEKQFGRLG